MRILQVIPSLGFGGAEREVARMSIALKQAGEDCQILCIREEGHLASEVRAAGVPVESLKTALPGSVGSFLSTVSYLRRERPDVMHSHLLAWTPIAGRIAGVPAIVTTEHGLSLWKGRARILLDRFAAGYADRVIGVAKAVVQVKHDRWGIPDEKLVFIPNGVDLRRFEFGVGPAEVKSGLGLATEDRMIVIVASLQAVKGHKYLLSAMPSVVNSIPDAHLVVVGDGPLLDELRTQVKELSLQDCVHFTGFRQDVERILKASDLFTLTSLREGTSIAVLEAMAAGVPVVATAVGGNPEVIEDGKSGLLVPSMNPAALATAITRVLGDRDFAASLVKEARLRVEHRYSAVENLQVLRDLYQSILAQRENTSL